MTGGTESVARAALEALVAGALERAGTRRESARSVAAALVGAEVDGQKGHGLSRLASYLAQVRSGKVSGQAVPSAVQTRPGSLIVDAGHGFAFPAFDVAVARLPKMAREVGLAAAGITRSHHGGALGLVVERLAAQGCVALMFANTPSAMAAWGGQRAVFGTNPIAFAAPRTDAAPIVVDLALSDVARGKIMAAAQRGEPIPAGWALDKEGQPTTDAKAALAGTLLPSGGAKGAALALMVEILSAAVTGAHFAGEASSFLDANGPPPGTGQLLVAIDATALGAGEGFGARLAGFAALIEAEPGVRLPGARRPALRERASGEGIAVDTKVLSEIRAMAGV